MADRPRHPGIPILAATLSGWVIASSAFAFGELDPEFGSGGIVIAGMPGSDGARAVAVQPDGKIVVASGNGGGFVLARFQADGRPDLSFGGDGEGFAVTAFGSTHHARDLLVQPDGKIVLAGHVRNDGLDFALVRYNPDGTHDSRFGAGGAVSVDLGFDSMATAAALQTDGGIVLAGYVSAGARYGFVRYSATGRLDTTFGEDGRIVLDINNRRDEPYDVALAVQPDGKLVMAAGHSPDNGGERILVVRLERDGSADPTFNARSPRPGMAIIDLGPGADRAFAVAVQPDGRILVAGSTETGDETTAVALLRLEADGTRDASFGDDGRVVIDTGRAHAAARSLALQPDGRILIAGEAGDGVASDFYVQRLAADGVPEPPAFIDLRSADRAWDIALQPDGRVIVAGASRQDGSARSDLALLRLVNGDPWRLTPAPFEFTPLADVPVGSVQTSEIVVLDGFAEGVDVPVSVLRGEFALNGATQYSSAGWARAGDQINVRHISSIIGQTNTETVVHAGGVRPVNNQALVLGGRSASFSSTSANTVIERGGGATGPAMLAALAVMLGWRVRTRPGRIDTWR